MIYEQPFISNFLYSKRIFISKQIIAYVVITSTRVRIYVYYRNNVAILSDDTVKFFKAISGISLKVRFD